MTSTVPVTVLIPTLGREPLLGECLASLAACDPRAAEVLVLDQSQTGAGGRALAAAGLHGRAVSMPALGIAAAMNVGLRAAAYDRVLVTHDDCRVAVDWVETGHSLLAAEPATLITGRVLAEEGTTGVPSTIDDPVGALHRGAPRADLLYPASMAVSAGAALALGGFDERFTLAAEDNDFCFRWMAGGGAVRYAPELTVWHRDWRPPHELKALYRRYWLAHGAFIAKHLRLRDRRAVRELTNSLVWAAQGAVRRRWKRDGPAVDETFAGVTHLPLGVVRAWRRMAPSGQPEPSQHESWRA